MRAGDASAAAGVASATASGSVLIVPAGLDVGLSLIKVVLVIIITFCAVADHRGRDDDAFRQVALRLESHGVCAVLDDLHFAVDVDVAVLALHGAVDKPGFQLEGSISSLVAICVRAILVMLIDLLENGDGRCCLELA